MCRGRRGFPIRQLSNTTMHFVEGELDSKSDERAFLNKKKYGHSHAILYLQNIRRLAVESQRNEII